MINRYSLVYPQKLLLSLMFAQKSSIQCGKRLSGNPKDPFQSGTTTIRIMKPRSFLTGVSHPIKYGFSTNKNQSDLPSSTTKFDFSIKDVINDHIIILEDTRSVLPYLKEVSLSIQNPETPDIQARQYKGLVIKIQDMKSYVALYSHLQPEDLETLNLRSFAVEKGKQVISIRLLESSCRTVQIPKQTNCLINAKNEIVYLDPVNHKTIEKSASYNEPHSNQANKFRHNSQRRRIQSTSPILASCYDLFYGDLILFQGGIGSGRTREVQATIKSFTRKQNHIGIYVSLGKRDSQKFIKSMNKSNTSNFIVFNQEFPTSTSAYVLTIKAVEMAKSLTAQGYNVLLAIDGVKQFLVHQWSLLTGIRSSLLPISIANQVYSSCTDQERIGGQKRGSLSSIMVCENSDLPQKVDIEHFQEISMYSNTIKHLMTLSESIKFPIDFKINHSRRKAPRQKISNQGPNDQLEIPSTSPISLEIRVFVNKLLIEKKDHQLKTSLNLTKDEPWQYYFLLDSKWWAAGMKTYIPKTIQDRDNFLLFVKWNISEELSSQWNQSCVQIYKRYREFIREKSRLNSEIEGDGRDVEFIYKELVGNNQFFEEFLVECKLEGYLDPFKRDYLA